MDLLASAIEQDIAQNHEKAAELYELAIKEVDAPLEAFINLACLYWDKLDPGAIRTKEFFKIAADRVYKVLEEAESKFGTKAEIEFWRLYFNWTLIGDPAFPERALELVDTGETITPYFYIYAALDDREQYLAFVQQIYDEAKAQPTAKNRYIISYLDSVFRRIEYIKNKRT